MRNREYVGMTILWTALLLGFNQTPATATSLGTGACCLAHGSCLDGYDIEPCTNIGGAYQGDETECSSVTCNAVPCGESGAPVCGGSCPAGARCIDPNDLLLAAVTVVQLPEAGQSPSSCECAEVLCGGVPIENGQGCCSGTPFTIGVQGCCNGEVVPVDSECLCGINFDEELAVVGLPTDLREAGCCTLLLPPPGAESPTENGGTTTDTRFNIAQFACCQRQMLGDFSGEPSVIAGLSIYTFATGLDCCSEKPLVVPEDLLPDGEIGVLDVVELNGLCVGGCSVGECASQDCCQCNGLPDSSCVAAGSRLSCEGFCGLQGAEVVRYVENGVCGEQGCEHSAPSPAVSRTGLVTLLLALIAIGGFAMIRSRRQNRAV